MTFKPIARIIFSYIDLPTVLTLTWMKLYAQMKCGNPDLLSGLKFFQGQV